MSIATPLTVIAGAFCRGRAAARLLALVNAMAARYGKAQQIFALLQTILVVLGVVLFFTLPRLQHCARTHGRVFDSRLLCRRSLRPF